MTIKWVENETVFRFEDGSIHAAYGTIAGSIWWNVNDLELEEAHKYGVEESLAIAKQNAEDAIVKFQKERKENAK